jgi:hypothetical protein
MAAEHARVSAATTSFISIRSSRPASTLRIGRKAAR